MIGFSIDGSGLRIHNDSHRISRSSNQLFDSFDDYPVKLQQAIDWLLALDIKISRQSRHYQYLETLEKHVSSGVKLQDALIKDANLSKVIFETYELVRIYRNFVGEESDALKGKLSEFVDGPIFYGSEDPANSGNKARNYGVEISVGGEMTMLGMAVSYGGCNHPEPLVHSQSGNVAIECKRPYSTKIKKIRDLFKEAADKVASYDTSEFSISSRIVVIDLTRYINPECDPFLPQSGLSVRGGFGSRIEEVKHAVFSAFSEDKYPGVDGLIFRATYSTIYPDQDNALEWSSRPLCVPLTSNTTFFEELNERYRQLSHARQFSNASTLKPSEQS